MERVLVVGLDKPEYSELRQKVEAPIVATELLPRIKVEAGRLFVEKPGTSVGVFLPVSKVVFHGIFENDFDFITALALWGGPCLPDALGMMECRLRLPGLVHALRASRFNTLPRGFADRGTVTSPAGDAVAKWGNWHCGENKERFGGRRERHEPTLVEQFVEGEAVRVVRVGDRSWQIRLAGDDWRKSIHPDAAAFMPIDRELEEDAVRLQRRFRLDVTGIDYMIGNDGTRHLLEVNHIPNVTRFAEIRAAYLDHAAEWIRGGEETAAFRTSSP